MYSFSTATLSTPLHSLEPRNSAVLKTREWRQQDKSEASASTQLEHLGEYVASTNMDKILVKWATCTLCGIGVGPDHVEQDLFLYPIQQQETYLADDSLTYFEYHWLLCCGGCARHKRRQLDSSLQVLSSSYWTTTYLSTGETTTLANREDAGQASMLRQLWHQTLLERGRLYVFLTLLSYRISPLALFVSQEQQQQVQRTRITSTLNERRTQRLLRTGSPHLRLVAASEAPDEPEPPTRVRLSRFRFQPLSSTSSLSTLVS